jgi:DNA-binding transcriptional MocR family regulator
MQDALRLAEERAAEGYRLHRGLAQLRQALARSVERGEVVSPTDVVDAIDAILAPGDDGSH